jgi:hypothetical protein
VLLIAVLLHERGADGGSVRVIACVTAPMAPL